MSATATAVGDHLRQWRQRRRLSQLDLALDAEISTRHLSFVETGRAQPSRDMVLRLADRVAFMVAGHVEKAMDVKGLAADAEVFRTYVGV